MSEKRVWSSLSPASPDMAGTEKRKCAESNDSFLYDDSTLVGDALSSTRVDEPPSPSPMLNANQRDLVAVMMRPEVLGRIAAVVAESVTASLQKDIADLRGQLKERDRKIDELTAQVDALEQYSRRNSLRISGIPEAKDENTDDVVRAVATSMGVDLPASAIDRSHRVGPPTSSASSPRSIIAKFVSYRDRLSLMVKRQALKGKTAGEILKKQGRSTNRVYINEDLTATRAKLAADARKLKREKKITDTWTRDGIIYVKKNDRVHKVTSGKDMDRFQ